MVNVVGVAALRFPKTLPRSLEIAAVGEHGRASLQRRGAQRAIPALESRGEQALALAFVAQRQVAVHQHIEQGIKLARERPVPCKPWLEQSDRARVLPFLVPLARRVVHREDVDAARRKLREALPEKGVEHVAQHVVFRQLEETLERQAAALVFLARTAGARVVAPRLGDAPCLKAGLGKRHRVVDGYAHRAEGEPGGARARVNLLRECGRERRARLGDPVEKHARVGGPDELSRRGIEQPEKLVFPGIGAGGGGGWPGGHGRMGLRLRDRGEPPLCLLAAFGEVRDPRRRRAPPRWN
ncbi:MAG: hypothetical protein M0015_01275 [Betaproteobacteria bacterium]|nr:hypothetical protein [Betaproteobacteria bacterium]